MTNLVTCQHANLEIATRLVINDRARMAARPQDKLSPTLFQEMQPHRIGHRMRLLRTALGLSSSEISDQLGMPRTYWSRFEGGKRAITDSMAALLVERFGVTLDFLILGKWDKLPFDLAARMRQIEDEKNNESSD